jgi:hypothetical protein
MELNSQNEKIKGFELEFWSFTPNGQATFGAESNSTFGNHGVQVKEKEKGPKLELKSNLDPSFFAPKG